jgi:hypothetical protein
MTPFTGQIENTEHFLQPTANAIGHKTTVFLLRVLFEDRTNPGNIVRGSDDKVCNFCTGVATSPADQAIP